MRGSRLSFGKAALIRELMSDGGRAFFRITETGSPRHDLPAAFAQRLAKFSFATSLKSGIP
jgi:hypothetical protein